MSRVFVRDARRVLAMGLISSLFSTSAVAWCDPAVDRSVKGEFESSSYVASVQVLKATWLDDSKLRRPKPLKQPLMLGTIPGGFDPYSGADYWVKVLKLYKGRPAHHLMIFSENTEARTPLKVGMQYFVFLQHGNVLGSDDARPTDLMIDYCGNSTVLKSADPIIHALPH